MQIVRTIIWVLILVALLAFSIFNWSPVEVTIWPDLILETKVPALVVVAFLIGLVPMWLVHRGVKWQLQRRITSLENAARSHVAVPADSPAPAVVERDPVHEPEPVVTRDPLAPGDPLAPQSDTRQ